VKGAGATTWCGVGPKSVGHGSKEEAANFGDPGSAETLDCGKRCGLRPVGGREVSLKKNWKTRELPREKKKRGGEPTRMADASIQFEGPDSAEKVKPRLRRKAAKQKKGRKCGEN